ncbi:hypothetical protein, partial [Hominenteromicrobium sp.]|uniref:hypothetical protein n=1 Tax=Hominenteromicrobium sp. TaxID=3073581 RepID=UPI003AF0458B
SGVYRLFGTPFGIKITPPVKHYIILSNKWGAVQKTAGVALPFFFFTRNSTGKRLNIQNYIIICKFDITRSEIDGTDF